MRQPLLLISMLAMAVLSGFMLAPSVLQDEAGSLTPYDLRVEYKTNLLNADMAQPRLSWKAASSVGGDMQTGYHIQVATSPRKLERNEADLWDSGLVPTGETINIPYSGKELTSGLDCYWRVRLEDRNAIAGEWSGTAHWKMGLLEPTDWRGHWIEGPGVDVEMTEDSLKLPPARYFRHSFVLGKPVHEAHIYLTALGLTEVYLNGQRVGDDYLKPGWTDFNKRVYYFTYDVAPLLKDGENVIAAVAADGWYAGYVGMNRVREYYGDNPKLLVQLNALYQDGTRDYVFTSDEWKVTTGAVLEADLLMGETHDARLEPKGWKVAGFDDSGWDEAVIAVNVNTLVQAMPNEPVGKFAEHTPLEITEPKPGVFVFDLGTNFAGFAKLVPGSVPAGTVLTLRFAEMLDEEGMAYTDNLREARVMDTYICSGEQGEAFEPMFTFHGFRYVELTGYPGTPDESVITGVELTQNLDWTGEFNCSNDLSNQLYANILQTQRSNFISIPTDCPQRDERLGWMGDAQIYVRTAANNAFVAPFFTKWMQDVNDAQYENGNYTNVAPMPMNLHGGSPAWTDAGVICPWTIYKMYDDTRILERYYSNMEEYIEYCRANSDGLIRPEEGFGDWLNVDDETPKSLLATAYFKYSCQLMAEISEALGKPARKQYYAQLSESVKEAFIDSFVNNDGTIYSDTQTSYVLALRYGLLPDGLRDEALDNLIRNIRERDWHLSTGFLGTKDLMMALSEEGRDDVAYRLFFNTTYPSWGFSIEQGATSIWERWNGWTPENGFFDPGMNSFAHYSFGAVGEWMFKVIGGISSTSNSFKRFRIAPVLDGSLTHADVSYESIRGTIRSSWKLSDETFALDVEIPANTRAEIVIPATREEDVTIDGLPIAATEGIASVHFRDNAVVVEAGSGVYKFNSASGKGMPAIPEISRTPEGLVTLASPSENAAIYYTLDGSDPAVGGEVYYGPFPLIEGGTVKAYDAGVMRYQSDVVAAELPHLAAPPPLITSGKVTAAAPAETAVMISSTLKDAVIRYTLDGTEPDHESPQYTQPLIIDETTMIKARAYKPPFKDGETASHGIALLEDENNDFYYRVYEGEWEKLPDFNALTPVMEGEIPKLTLDIPDRPSDYFAVSYTAMLHLPFAGEYTFYLTSDDGSRLIIDNRVVVNNDAVQAPTTLPGVVTLQAGEHTIEVQFFDNWYGEELQLEIKSDFLTRRTLPPLLVRPRD